jgi:hypothetical protein
VHVRENAAIGTVVATVSATSGTANGLQYRIVGGNVNAALAINEVGDLNGWLVGLID